MFYSVIWVFLVVTCAAGDVVAIFMFA